jgi:hypothetical protein
VRDFIETEESVIILPFIETESSGVGTIQPIHVFGSDQFPPSEVEETVVA